MIYKRNLSDTATERKNVCLTKGQSEAFEYLKKTQGLSRSAATRIALDDYLERVLKGDANGK